jgi:hypothetical protein
MTSVITYQTKDDSHILDVVVDRLIDTKQAMPSRAASRIWNGTWNMARSLKTER